MKKSNQKAIQMSLVALLGAALSSGTVFGQQSTFGGTVITAPLGPGLQLTATTNLTTLSQASTLTTTGTKKGTPEVARNMRRFRMPPLKSKSSGTVVSTPSLTKALQVASAPTNAGFTGLTHADQRNANGGNQFSTEPANPNIAVANGYVLNVVNDAVRVFSTTGVALTNPVSLNQIFALAPAINWNVTPNVYGTFLLDSRAFYDQDFSRWFVLAQDQDNDASGNYLSSSHIYLAVSQTSDPTGGYNVYSMDSSDTSNPGCPCYQDYVQIGADHYGIYITSDEFSIQDLTNTYFNDAQVQAIAKSDLSSGVATPQMYQFLVPNYGDGFEAFIRPASVPPGASNFLASGGAEFLVSSDYGGYDYRLAIWAVTNTASLQSSNPALLLTQNFVNTSTYYYLPPDGISQKPGPLTLGNTEEYLDGSDVSYSLVISAVYAGGRLFVTVPTEVANFTTFTIQAGGFYAVFAPTLRNGVLSSPPPDKQGNLSITGDGILRPAITVNAQGTGIIAFTVSGPDYYPSAGYANFDLTSATPSTVQIVGQGYSPEDGFTGYNQVTLVNPSLCPTCQGDGVARWGDFSTAVTSSDGSFWYCVEYIPNAITYPRTPLANWGTFIGQYSLLTPTSAARQ